MPNPYDRESERDNNWTFNLRTGEWDFTHKIQKQPPIKPKIETQANDKGVQIRIVGTEKWIPVSELFTPPQK